MTDVESLVLDGIVEVSPFAVSASTLTSTTLLGESPDGHMPAIGLDSLSILELLAMLEGELGIELVDHLGSDVLTVGRIVDLCGQQVAGLTGASMPRTQ